MPIVTPNTDVGEDTDVFLTQGVGQNQAMNNLGTGAQPVPFLFCGGENTSYGIFPIGIFYLHIR